jgi:hypothetical protein
VLARRQRLAQPPVGGAGADGRERQHLRAAVDLDREVVEAAARGREAQAEPGAGEAGAQLAAAPGEQPGTAHGFAAAAGEAPPRVVGLHQLPRRRRQQRRFPHEAGGLQRGRIQPGRHHRQKTGRPAAAGPLVALDAHVQQVGAGQQVAADDRVVPAQVAHALGHLALQRDDRPVVDPGLEIAVLRALGMEDRDLTAPDQEGRLGIVRRGHPARGLAARQPRPFGVDLAATHEAAVARRLEAVAGEVANELVCAAVQRRRQLAGRGASRGAGRFGQGLGHRLRDQVVAWLIGVHRLVVKPLPAVLAGVGAPLHPPAEVDRGDAVVRGEPRLQVHRVALAVAPLGEQQRDHRRWPGRRQQPAQHRLVAAAPHLGVEPTVVDAELDDHQVGRRVQHMRLQALHRRGRVGAAHAGIDQAHRPAAAQLLGDLRGPAAFTRRVRGVAGGDRATDSGQGDGLPGVQALQHVLQASIGGHRRAQGGCRDRDGACHGL